MQFFQPGSQMFAMPGLISSRSHVYTAAKGLSLVHTTKFSFASSLVAVLAYNEIVYNEQVFPRKFSLRSLICSLLYTAGQVFLDHNVNVRTFAIPCPAFFAGRTHEQCSLTSKNLSIYAVHTNK